MQDRVQPTLKVRQIVSGANHRTHFDHKAMADLEDGLRAAGRVTQPIQVRPHPTQTGTWEIIAGERRWRAASKVFGDDYDLDDSFLPNADGAFLGYGPVLSWQTDDITVRVFDDYANDASQGDFYDWIGAYRFDVNDPQAVRDWMAAITVRLDGVRLLDTLIHELSMGDWPWTSASRMTTHRRARFACRWQRRDCSSMTRS